MAGETDLNLSSTLLCALPVIPLVGAIASYLFSRRRQEWSGWLATLGAGLAFLCALRIFLSLGHESGSGVLATAWEWFRVGSLRVDFAFRFDHLSAVMALVVTGVGSLIHLYAIGYMAEDENRPRFFAYLNLFLFAMLLLVLGDNLLVMFVGWEGVGLCSYLLIGFWYREPANAVAGQKAFIVNRIGDVGFVLGIFTILSFTPAMSFGELSQAIRFFPDWALELSAFLLFVGAMGKSAQVPLYVWLPDAMAGPTPVSALIHAATMVTAGVYMLARMSFLYVLAPNTLIFVSVIGGITALLAATIALVQYDIKKVLAYSTVSQLGYMFLAMGATAFSNGIYHLVTHALFKACLFMSAGSVIIGCHHEQDMRHFGGLRKKMPITFATYLIATLAIAGIPPLSGFWSKDAILWSVFAAENPASAVRVFGVQLSHLLWAVGFITAGLTAFYMTRSLVLTFFGEYRGHAHPHESPLVVTVPLVVLAFSSAVFGAYYGADLIHYLALWTRPDLLAHGEHSAAQRSLEIASIAMAAVGVIGALVIYLRAPKVLRLLVEKMPLLYRALLNKWWVDEAYDAVIVRPLRAVAQFSFSFVDRIVIDGTVNGTAAIVDTNGEVTSRIHTGQLAHYLVLMFGGMLFLTLFWLIL